MITIIQIQDISSYRTEVKICDVPFPVTKHMLFKILQEYGEVDHMFYRNKTEVKYFKGISGRVTALMRLNKNIPSALFLKQFDSFMFIQYENQPQTCHGCGDQRHSFYNCQRYPEDEHNPIHIDLDYIFESGNNMPSSEASEATDTRSEISDHTDTTPAHGAHSHSSRAQHTSHKPTKHEK